MLYNWIDRPYMNKQTIQIENELRNFCCFFLFVWLPDTIAIGISIALISVLSLLFQFTCATRNELSEKIKIECKHYKFYIFFTTWDNEATNIDTSI